MKLFAHVGFSALLIAAGVARGQESNGFTLDQCLQLAREKNASLRIATAGTKMAELARSEFRTTTLPALKFSSGASYAPSTHTSGYDPAISNEGELSAQLELEQTLYDGGIRSLRGDQLQLDIERSALARRATERDLSYAVRQSFIDLLRATGEEELLRESSRQLADYLTIVERRVRAGGGSQTDLLKTRVELASAEVEAGKAASARSSAALALSELLGGAIDTSLRPLGSLESLIGPAADSLAPPVAPDSGRSLDMQIADIALHQVSLDAEMTGRERYPRISLFGDAGILTSIENLRLPPEERFGIAGYQVGATLEMPIFNWGGTDLRRQERELAADTLRLQSQLLQRSLERELRATTLALGSAKRHLGVIRGSLTSAEQNYLLTKSTYAGGGSLSLEVLSAQQLLTETRMSELETLAEIQLLFARLQQLTTH